jgi:hypothetical protein
MDICISREKRGGACLAHFSTVIPACFWRRIWQKRSVFTFAVLECPAMRGGKSLDSRQKPAGMARVVGSQGFLLAGSMRCADTNAGKAGEGKA